MTKVLVLGLGNDLIADDAVGLAVVREVRRRLSVEPSVEIRETTEAGLGLLDFIVDHEGLIVVDAIHTGEFPPGHVHELEGDELALRAAPFPHATAIPELCAFARLRGLSAPQHVAIVAVEVQDPYTIGGEMTEVVERAIDEAADVVERYALEFAHPSTLPR